MGLVLQGKFYHVKIGLPCPVRVTPEDISNQVTPYRLYKALGQLLGVTMLH